MRGKASTQVEVTLRGKVVRIKARDEREARALEAALTYRRLAMLDIEGRSALYDQEFYGGKSACNEQPSFRESPGATGAQIAAMVPLCDAGNGALPDEAA